MPRTLIPVLYRFVRPASGRTLVDLVRHAHVLGYELVPFNGYDPITPASPEERAIRWQNFDRLCEIARVEMHLDGSEIFEVWADDLRPVYGQQDLLRTLMGEPNDGDWED